MNTLKWYLSSRISKTAKEAEIIQTNNPIVIEWLSEYYIAILGIE